MRKLNLLEIFLSLPFVLGAFSLNALDSDNTIKTVYEVYKKQPSDINEHLPPLKELASQCSSVVEIGIRSMVSTWGIIQGLSESKMQNRSYTGVDLYPPPLEKLLLAERFAEENGIAFRFMQGNDMQLDIPPSDMLFIDSLHTYCHLTYELEKFSPNVKKFIAMHDTSPPWESVDDTEYHGNFSEYPDSYDKTKRGLWPAVLDFLSKHQEWKLKERRINNHGLTILERVSE